MNQIVVDKPRDVEAELNNLAMSQSAQPLMEAVLKQIGRAHV